MQFKPAKAFAGKVYLHLYHGRDTSTQDMEENGYDGPYILVDCFAFMYNELKIYIDKQEHILKVDDGCIEWEGKYYGCFDVVEAQRITEGENHA